MEQNKQYLLSLLEKAGAVKHGDFTLASGKKSKYYIDAKKLLSSKSLAVVAKMLSFYIYDACPTIDAIGGPELGGALLGSSVLTHWGITLRLWGYENDVAGFAVRKEAKGHGLKKKVEGTLDDTRVHNVAITEDVITTGASTLKAVEAVEELGHMVKVVACVVDRLQGGREIFEERGIRFIPLLTAKDIVKTDDLGVEWDSDEFRS